MREWLKWLIAGHELRALQRYRMACGLVWRWNGGIKASDATAEWIREVGEGKRGADIEQFRERLRLIPTQSRAVPASTAQVDVAMPRTRREQFLATGYEFADPVAQPSCPVCGYVRCRCCPSQEPQGADMTAAVAQGETDPQLTVILEHLSKIAEKRAAQPRAVSGEVRGRVALLIHQQGRIHDLVTIRAQVDEVCDALAAVSTQEEPVAQGEAESYCERGDCLCHMAIADCRLKRTHPTTPVGVPGDDSASVAAIQFALHGEDGLAFLRCWNEGNFDACRREWPEAPAECYIGADPLAAPSQEPQS